MSKQSSSTQESERQSTIAKEPIAIIGIGCRFPGNTNSPEEFWNGLKNGMDAITDVPADRWRLDAFYDPNASKAGKIKSAKGGFIPDVDKFDAEFFDIFPAEASRIDPQQRLLLEITYQALEDAGITLEQFSGSKTGVYMGVFMNDYWDIQVSSLQRNQISPHVPMGVSLTAIANRISYVYNLKGPSMTLDTACSSSLVGVHLACQSIWSGESTQALAGGVNLILRPESSIMMSKGGFLSPDGYCKSFDSRANGYVRSEGSGVVFLKPLAQAEKNGDHIYAVIRGSAVNSDGYTEEGFTVPSYDAQVDMLRNAYADAGVNPQQVGYVEAHGTGTPVGDPIETKAFGTVLGEKREDSNKLLIGSVKSNIGHLESAAGVAGLIKVALALKHQQIPKNLHFLHPNPNIPFDQYKLKVSTELQAWPDKRGPAIGGVNSFGAGGTNAHVVLQEYQLPKIPALPTLETPADDEQLQLFTLSAKNAEALKATIQKYIPFLQNTEASLRNICFSAATRRSVHPYKLTVAARSKHMLLAHLEAYLADESRPGMYAGKDAGKRSKLGFIYSGQGPQWFAMGQQLLNSSAVFREVILRIDQLFSKIADWSLLEEMSRNEATSRIGETRIAQPAIMAIQIGLTEVWKSWGILPDGVVGHSIGEVAAAYAAGALTLEQAVEVIYHRSRGQDKATDKGRMLAVGLPLDAARKEINGWEAQVSVAAINGPKMVALSGDTEVIERIAQSLDKRDVFHRILKVNVPFHSHHMEPLKEELISSLEQLIPSKALVPLYSTVTGKQEDGTHLVSSYWFQNVREPVYFTDALQQMVNDGYDTFIEIAPHPVLAEGATELLHSNIRNGLVLPSLRRKEEEEVTMMGTLGKLFVHGYPLNWQKLFNDSCQFVKLPAYAWQHESYWFESDEHKQKRLGSTLHPYLDTCKQSAVDANLLLWDLSIDKQVFPYLEDHKVDGTIVFPGTGHLEIAHAIAYTSFPDKFSFLEDIHFEAALFLPEEGESPEIRLEISSLEGDYVLCSKPRNSQEATWTKHSRGKINTLSTMAPATRVDLEAIRKRVNTQLSVTDYYLELKEDGLQYGESFRCIQKLWRSETEVLGALALDKSTVYGLEKYHFHPALLDACLHIIFAVKPGTDTERRGVYLPVHIERLQMYQQPGTNVFSYVQLTQINDSFLTGDFFILSETGETIAQIQEVTCKYIEGSRGEQPNDLYNGMYTYQWERMTEQETSAIPHAAQTIGSTGTASAETYLIFTDSKGIGKQLADRLQASGIQPTVLKKGNAFDATASQQAMDQVFETMWLQGKKVQKIIYLWGLDTEFSETLTCQELAMQQQLLTQQTMSMLKAVVNNGIEPAIYMVTQGVEALSAEEAVNVSQAAMYGLGRVLKNEYPFIPLSILDISQQVTAAEIDNLYKECISRQASATELALRGTSKYLRKLEKVTAESATMTASKTVAALRYPFRAVVKAYGVLDGIVFQETKRPLPKADEVEIEVRAAGLNFKDVLNTMGLLSNEAVEGGVVGKNLGLECAGIITAVGANVQGYAIGDAVMAWASDSFAGYTIAHISCVVPKPAHLTFEQATTIPVVYLTAYYSLYHLGRISEGDRVLIHAASGGVGLAAIQLAQLAGAEIIATAGSEEKRAYLRSLGIPHVFDSRSLQFAEQVMDVTGGKGVDLVLNSLSGKAITQSIKCLAPFGKFIEIGKADIYNDAKLGLKRFGNNLSYHAVDVDRLMLQKPKLGKKLFTEIQAMLVSGQLTALPYTTFPVAKLSEALAYMSKAVHVGKLVISVDEHPVNVTPAENLVLDAKGTYVISGGASGFGLELATWLTQKGARYVVLLSRSGCKTDEDTQAVLSMMQQGVGVVLESVDITNAAAIQKVFNRIKDTMPPVKGIIHSAAILDDATIPNMDQSRFQRVFDTKVLGAWNLHQASLNEPVDFFLMLSSISAIFGLPGQSNYSAANNFLDKLAHYRQSKGLAASSVNLGVLGMYAGMSKEGGQVINVLANQGWLPLTLTQVTAKLENILLQKPAQRMAANLDWKRFKEFFTHLNSDSRFAHLMTSEGLKNKSGSSTNAALVDQLIALPAETQPAFLQEKLAESLAKILGTSASKIDCTLSISKIGLDSLMLNQLRNWIQQKMGINYPLMKIAKGPSIAELATQLIGELSVGNTPAQAAAADTSGIASETDIEVLDTWMVRNKKNTQAIKTRIFCIHPVGAGASMFSHFMYNPPQETDVLAFQLPGRENRSAEVPYENMDLLIQDMARVIAPYLDKPFIILGHSFGGIIGFELIRYLRKHFGVTPLQLFITGTIPPQLTKRWKETDSIRETAVFTNSEEKLLSLMTYIDDVEFLKRILPVMRKDMPLIMSYRYEEQALFDFPIYAFAADKDEVVLVEQIRSWKQQTASTFSMEVVEGDHWFLSRNKELILSRLTEALQVAVAHS
ncbi:SDR family NAD(P)-dependent oxidoreductase [Rhodocytophaga aerolata]|uniref:SDR family NAD(P)-dependent oxidoreductase n=1 Tax=Rhodocytophaga aerolata TaxID=455078 RepID=A0ABT8RAA5_9BACT|nr:type I polyketide synthase [Rhodocytophaga aerolata]MDO1449031.1 SDR family NAD(P)-dependent oxidoreductase [Rhodocytophaga aerolata]